MKVLSGRQGMSRTTTLLVVIVLVLAIIAAMLGSGSMTPKTVTVTKTIRTTLSYTVTKTETVTLVQHAGEKPLSLPPGTVQVTLAATPGNVTLSGTPAGYNVHDGVWVVWCADRYTFINATQSYTANLYSSYDPNLPPCLKEGKQWDMVNYILNHRDNASYMDIQQAIWYFTQTNRTMPESPAGQALVGNALANGSGFQPGPGQVEAVVIFISCKVQPVFIEVDP